MYTIRLNILGTLWPNKAVTITEVIQDQTSEVGGILSDVWENY